MAQHGGYGIRPHTALGWRHQRRLPPFSWQYRIPFRRFLQFTAPDGKPESIRFSSSANGQELYCQMDCGFTPVQFVFGNIAYSVGAAGGIIGSLKSMARGEIKEFSQVFNHTRHLCLQRIADEARQCGANAVVGIETRDHAVSGHARDADDGNGLLQHPMLSAAHQQQPVTSDLTNQEMWNLTAMGYLPLKLVLGTAVYSLGIVGGIKAAFKSFSRGEISDLTTLVYDAREHAIGLIKAEATAIGADDVVGVKTHIHELGNLIEFMAIGTAVKKIPGVKTVNPALPPQAIMKDKETWIS